MVGSLDLTFELIIWGVFTAKTEKPKTAMTTSVIDFSFIASYSLEMGSLEFRVGKFRVGGGKL